MVARTVDMAVVEAMVTMVDTDTAVTAALVDTVVIVEITVVTGTTTIDF